MTWLGKSYFFSVIQIVFIQQGFIGNKEPDSIPGPWDLSVSFLGPLVLIASLWQQN